MSTHHPRRHQVIGCASQPRAGILRRVSSTVWSWASTEPRDAAVNGSVGRPRPRRRSSTSSRARSPPTSSHFRATLMADNFLQASLATATAAHLNLRLLRVRTPGKCAPGSSRPDSPANQLVLGLSLGPGGRSGSTNHRTSLLESRTLIRRSSAISSPRGAGIDFSATAASGRASSGSLGVDRCSGRSCVLRGRRPAIRLPRSELLPGGGSGCAVLRTGTG
jgi:hypothetical protein